MKVLLFSNDTMPFGALPTSGGGLRCWQLYQGLISKGIEVIASMPAFTFLTQKYFDQIPEDVKSYLWEWHTQDEILARVKPDAVIFASNWDHYNLSKKPSVPLIVDLHGSRLIETSLFGNPQDPNKKVDVFSKADCLLTAGKRQRNYFYGWLTQAGRVPLGEHFIRYIPVSVSPEKFERQDHLRSTDESPLFVSGGGWFPWQDQSRAIFRISETVCNSKKGQFKIFGTPHNQETISKEELEIRKVFTKITELASTEPRIKVVGYLGRDELLLEYRRASVAVELMKKNLERELAFTTRTIEYLWCGLPVIYNDYSEISEHIKEYDAGWTIDPEKPEQLDSCLETIFSSPEIVKTKSENAQKLVRDRFSWDKTILPLVNFLENPVVRTQSKAAIGHVYVGAPYLSPNDSDQVKICIESGNQLKIVQEFIYPAEGIWALEIPYCLYTKSIDELNSTDFNISVKNSLGITVSKKTGKISELASSTFSNNQNLNIEGSIMLTLSRLLRPRGGSTGQIIINISGPAATDLSFKGLQKAIYPLGKLSSTQISNSQHNNPVLALKFYPGFGRLYYFINKAERVIWMIKKGEYLRVVRAIKKRALPKLRYLVKASSTK